jgi:hypothetical protein
LGARAAEATGILIYYAYNKWYLFIMLITNDSYLLWL